MTTTLLSPIHTLVTMDAARTEIRNAAVLIRDNAVEAVGAPDDFRDVPADRTIRLDRHVVTPGLINTHHHMFQNLTRVVAQDHELFGWLTTLYKIWHGLTPEMIRISTQTAIAELMLSGCTAGSDHLYLYLNGARIDDEIEAAREMGFRFHPTRGSMSVGESLGGLPPDSLCEPEPHILRETQRAIEVFHDPGRFAMTRVGIAPTAPFNVSQDLMREAAAMARALGVRLHTHLAENISDIDYSLEHFGMRPGEYAESVGWVGDDVWHAHCVQLDSAEIDLFARTGTGVAHCPCSNARLASGIAPIAQMLTKGVRVGLGVDGSASNDSGHLLTEARQALLMQRAVSANPAAMTARTALELATLGGASVLGRDDIGALVPGMAADLAAFRIDTVSMAGTSLDPVAALILSGPHRADVVMINGRVVVADGQLVPVDLPVLLERHAKASAELLKNA
ncbi:MAG: 8-oxoguanine deaminase [Anaerolineae bacterium]|nr:MAG: putative hydrolase [Chloroflexi bacterium OLB13]MBC6955354.1 8-oxoguanine deaminase [Chloroflexota bacterium]MCO6443515.1 8-oxoguanine deaminase [Anaerolineae bacterium]MEB2364544.1 8-oxoguanine deaminase [Chloroflexota bacterium]